MAVVPVFLPRYLWGVSTDLEKVAAAFPTIIRGDRERS
jgi:hypothetical protein